MDPNEDPALANGAPGVADPVEDPGTQVNWDVDDNPWKSRFETYRSEADRRATQLSQYEQNLADLRSGDTERQRAAAEALGIELVYDEQDDVPTYDDDPIEALRAELDSVKGQLSSREQREQQDRLAAEVDTRLAKLGLDEEDGDTVLRLAISMPGEDGVPDVARAFEVLKARDEAKVKAAMQEWGKSKRAPTSIQPGTPGTQQKNVVDMTPAERVAYGAERLAAMEAD